MPTVLLRKYLLNERMKIPKELRKRLGTQNSIGPEFKPSVHFLRYMTLVSHVSHKPQISHW